MMKNDEENELSEFPNHLKEIFTNIILKTIRLTHKKKHL